MRLTININNQLLGTHATFCVMMSVVWLCICALNVLFLVKTKIKEQRIALHRYKAKLRKERERAIEKEREGESEQIALIWLSGVRKYNQT